MVFMKAIYAPTLFAHCRLCPSDSPGVVYVLSCYYSAYCSSLPRWGLGSGTLRGGTEDKALGGCGRLKLCFAVRGGPKLAQPPFNSPASANTCLPAKHTFLPNKANFYSVEAQKNKAKTKPSKPNFRVKQSQFEPFSCRKTFSNPTWCLGALVVNFPFRI